MILHYLLVVVFVVVHQLHQIFQRLYLAKILLPLLLFKYALFIPCLLDQLFVVSSLLLDFLVNLLNLVLNIAQSLIG